MIKKIKSLTKRNKVLLSIVTLLIVVLGTSYAFFGFELGTPGVTPGDVTSAISQRLVFEQGTPIALSATKENFGLGDGSLTGSSTAKATLIKGEDDVSASDSYHVYFNFIKNNYVYTTSDKKPEIILTVTDPTGTEVTSIPGYNYVTVTDAATGNAIKGFDITTTLGLIKISLDYPITTNSETTHNWEFKLTFVNLTTSQNKNMGKTLETEVILRKDLMPEPPTLFINAPETYYVGPNTVVTCSSATANWNSKYNSIRISSLTPYSECTLSKTDTSSYTPLDDHIASLVGTTQGTGEVVEENGIRYQGKNPNNWIWFNEEYWRVIGVFDTILADGTTTETLTKIIRADSIGGYVWDSGNVNDWNESTLKDMLNTSYLNSEDSTGTSNCYGYSTTVPSTCDFTVTGIKDEYRNYLVDVTWNLGGLASAGSVSTVYTGERGGTVYSGRPTSGTGKVGLMYLSDYGYSVLASSCSRTTNLSSYSNANCAGSSWLYSEGLEWTIVPHSSDSRYAWLVSLNGSADYSSAYVGYSGRPTVYLSTATKYVGGAGTQTDPIIIS